MGEVRLRNWTICPTSLGVCVDGIRVDDEHGAYWHSSTILKRISERRLETETGTIYHLMSDLDEDYAKEASDCLWSVRVQFKKGFPKRWRKWVEKAKSDPPKKLEDIQPMDKVRKRKTRGKRSKKKTDKPKNLIGAPLRIPETVDCSVVLHPLKVGRTGRVILAPPHKLRSSLDPMLLRSRNTVVSPEQNLSMNDTADDTFLALRDLKMRGFQDNSRKRRYESTLRSESKRPKVCGTEKKGGNYDVFFPTPDMEANDVVLDTRSSCRMTLRNRKSRIMMDIEPDILTQDNTILYSFEGSGEPVSSGSRLKMVSNVMTQGLENDILQRSFLDCTPINVLRKSKKRTRKIALLKHTGERKQRSEAIKDNVGPSSGSSYGSISEIISDRQSQRKSSRIKSPNNGLESELEPNEGNQREDFVQQNELNSYEPPMTGGEVRSNMCPKSQRRSKSKLKVDFSDCSGQKSTPHEISQPEQQVTDGGKRVDVVQDNKGPVLGSGQETPKSANRRIIVTPSAGQTPEEKRRTDPVRRSARIRSRMSARSLDMSPEAPSSEDKSRKISGCLTTGDRRKRGRSVRAAAVVGRENKTQNQKPKNKVSIGRRKEKGTSEQNDERDLEEGKRASIPNRAQPVKRNSIVEECCLTKPSSEPSATKTLTATATATTRTPDKISAVATVPVGATGERLANQIRPDRDDSEKDDLPTTKDAQATNIKLLGGRGTMKREKALKKLIEENLESKDNNDFFTSTPFQNKRSKLLKLPKIPSDFGDVFEDDGNERIYAPADVTPHGLFPVMNYSETESPTTTACFTGTPLTAKSTRNNMQSYVHKLKQKLGKGNRGRFLTSRNISRNILKKPSHKTEHLTRAPPSAFVLDEELLTVETVNEEKSEEEDNYFTDE